ncbi:transcription elongation factor Spt5 [Candidatus Woesearchaeota archaeon CG10_big_fil_rev_8_21_14_0_10_45_5]|nr:MAG: transcription elongation factor Spt5 [Candidatus Woesearchaeota archaeon CG10_big_fil_rev_8_21_14_0_10_45_5]PIU29933.1 MAG: transcription elongation factor Spt5 [Candidatus Woesearchaeota archaeon CG07_land_8_20_14_0_80_44_23]
MAEEKKRETSIFALRVTANREDQVMDFVASNVQRKGIAVYSVIRPHGMRGYLFLEAERMQDADEGAKNVPYARGILPSPVPYGEIEHMLESRKIADLNIKKNDIVEIISGPFKREQAKIMRIDKTKEEVVVELLEAAVPVPITIKMDSVKTIRREEEAAAEESDDELQDEQ